MWILPIEKLWPVFDRFEFIRRVFYIPDLHFCFIFQVTCNLICDLEDKTKIEIWNTKDSPNQFKTTENWPELFYWMNPHLFIVPDSFFPDY